MKKVKRSSAFHLGMQVSAAAIVAAMAGVAIPGYAYAAELNTDLDAQNAGVEVVSSDSTVKNETETFDLVEQNVVVARANVKAKIANLDQATKTYQDSLKDVEVAKDNLAAVVEFNNANGLTKQGLVDAKAKLVELQKVAAEQSQKKVAADSQVQSSHDKVMSLVATIEQYRLDVLTTQEQYDEARVAYEKASSRYAKAEAKLQKALKRNNFFLINDAKLVHEKASAEYKQASMTYNQLSTKLIQLKQTQYDLEHEADALMDQLISEKGIAQDVLRQINETRSAIDAQKATVESIKSGLANVDEAREALRTANKEVLKNANAIDEAKAELKEASAALDAAYEVK